MTVRFTDLELAFDFVSSAALGESQAVLDRRSGRIYFHSELLGGMEEEEFPDDIEDDKKYIEIPHKNELDLGTPLVFRFVREFLPDDYDEVCNAFRRKGAYGRFKALLARRGRHRPLANEAEKTALREWCAENDIALID